LSGGSAGFAFSRLARRADMDIRRKLNRRSFLSRVAGGAIVGGGAIAFVAGSAAAHPTSDNDPTDPGGASPRQGTWPHSDTDEGATADPVGRAGRLGHYSDTDSGPGSDPVNHGRRITDSDPRDPPNYRPQITDSDGGSYGDPAGRGRRPRR
jgi:hypothetical protein